MPMIDKPPVSPQVQAQMGPPTPGGPNFGPGMANAMQQQGKSQAELAVSTVEKILMGVQGDKFQEYAKKAIAILKVGLAMEQQQGPQSKGMPTPPPQAEGAKPPAQTPGQMPG